MYDALTSTFALPCPHRGKARLPLSSFRALDRLPGPTRPAVFSVVFACSCGGVHPGLVTHDELDIAPLGIGVSGTFRNLMTAQDDSVEAELSNLAASRIRAGEWPWSFFCCLEAKPRPITPSAIALIAPEEGRFGLAVRCPACSRISVNLVSREHVDIPFWNDSHVAVLDQVFDDTSLQTVDALHAELASCRVDDRTMHLEL